ncbi:MAG: hypothetical protein KAG28_05240 [Cocleimonas sp.]|nr:hypothetical protein [Cocleimonas sp.]
MSNYVPQQDLYLGVTPAGCYYAVQENKNEPGRNFLHNILRQLETPLFNIKVACAFSGLKKKNALEFVHWLQDAGFIYGTEDPEDAPQHSLEELLSEKLQSLSNEGKVVLAGSQGLYLGAAGFPHEVAEELAAMSASLTKVYQHHKSVLKGNLGYRQQALGLVDSSGNSEIGFWPVYIGDDFFTLIVAGMPQFNQNNFKEIIWALSTRYDMS